MVPVVLVPRVRAARPVLKTRVLRGTWHRPGTAPATGTSRPVGRAIDKNWDPERGSAAARQWRHPCAKDCGLRHYKSDAIVSAPFFFQNLFFFFLCRAGRPYAKSAAVFAVAEQAAAHSFFFTRESDPYAEMWFPNGTANLPPATVSALLFFLDVL